jgi:hypothetical protein
MSQINADSDKGEFGVFSGKKLAREYPDSPHISIGGRE